MTVFRIYHIIMRTGLKFTVEQLHYHKFNECLWKIKNCYGLRWKVEIYFSGIKRLFGEVIRAIKPDNIVEDF